MSQYRTEAQVLASDHRRRLVPYWNQSEVSSFVAGQLSNYATNSSVTSSISSALSSYDNSSQVDISPAGLLHEQRRIRRSQRPEQR